MIIMITNMHGPVAVDQFGRDALQESEGEKRENQMPTVL